MTKCILWTGAHHPFGYGMRTIKNKNYLVHRLILAKKLGRPIKKGYCACHSCDTPACINPEHLFEATQSENLKDMFAKNRNGIGKGCRHFSKLTQNQVRGIRNLKENNTLKLAQQFGVSRRHIQSILAGDYWKHII